MTNINNSSLNSLLNAKILASKAVNSSTDESKKSKEEPQQAPAPKETIKTQASSLDALANYNLISVNKNTSTNAASTTAKSTPAPTPTPAPATTNQKSAPASASNNAPIINNVVSANVNMFAATSGASKTANVLKSGDGDGTSYTISGNTDQHPNGVSYDFVDNDGDGKVSIGDEIHYKGGIFKYVGTLDITSSGSSTQGGKTVMGFLNAATGGFIGFINAALTNKTTNATTTVNPAETNKVNIDKTIGDANIIAKIKDAYASVVSINAKAILDAGKDAASKFDEVFKYLTDIDNVYPGVANFFLSYMNDQFSSLVPAKYRDKIPTKAIIDDLFKRVSDMYKGGNSNILGIGAQYAFAPALNGMNFMTNIDGTVPNGPGTNPVTGAPKQIITFPKIQTNQYGVPVGPSGAPGGNFITNNVLAILTFSNNPANGNREYWDHKSIDWGDWYFCPIPLPTKWVATASFAVKDSLDWAKKEVKAGVKAAAEGIGNAAVWTAKTVASGVSSAAKAVASAATTVATTVAKAVSNVATTATKVVTSVATPVVKAVSGVASTVASAATTATKAVASGVSAAASAVGNAAASAAKSVGSAAKSVFKAITSW